MALISPAKGPSVALPLPVNLNPRRREIIISASLSPTTEVDWVKETASFFEKDPRPIMLFDGVCNLCNGGVKFVRNNDRKRNERRSYHHIESGSWLKHPAVFRLGWCWNIRFEALQGEAGKKLLQRSGRSPDDISSVVLVEKDRSYIKSEAVLKIMEYINFPFPQLAFFLQFMPLFIRDFAYDKVADNRYSFFGRSDSCDL